MPILKKSDIAAKGILDDYIKKVKEATAETKKLQEQVRSVNKTGTGSEAEKRITLANKLTTSTKKLKNALTDEERVKQQILRANAKLSESRTKSAKDLALVRQKTQQQTRALREQAKAQLGVRKGLSSLTKQMFAGVGIIAGLRILGNVLKDAFKIMLDFSKASSGLAAILKKTKSEIKVLTDQAKLLGSTTAFTASEVIKLQPELARIGFEINEIRDATPAILDLAAAVGVNLADAAQVSGGIVRAFGLSTKDTKEVVDSMVATLNNSGAAFEDYREAVKLSAPIFKAANIDFKTMNLLIGNLADSQIKGSIAGTGLKNLISKLSDEGSNLSKELGFTVKNSDDLVRAFEVLRTKNLDLTDATELTDERSKAAFLTLIQGVDSADKLSVALNNLDDNAKKTADTMLNNLAGDMTIAQSAWEGLVLSIADGEGVISKAVREIVQEFTDFLGVLTTFNEVDFVNKLKIMANSVLALFNRFVPLVDIFNTLTGSNVEFKFNVDKTTEALELQRIEMDFTVRLTKEQKENLEKLNTTQETAAEKTKRLAEERKRLAKITKQLAKEQREISKEMKLNILLLDQQIKQSAEAERGFDIDDQLLEDQQELDALQDKEDKKAVIGDIAREEELRKIQAQADAKVMITEAAEQAITQLASDIFSSFQDEKLAKINSDAEAQKAILQQRLDDGVISEEQFASQVANIEKKARIESAKAEKKKALFDIAIATAVAVAKAGFITPAAIAILIAGGIQAAAVALRPIPKFEKGKVNIGGKSHAEGGNIVEVERGESYINKAATAQSENILNAVNAGMLTDKNFNSMSKEDSDMLIATLLIQGNKNSNDIITLMANMGWAYPEDGEMKVNYADGRHKKRFNL